jgi:hypothetical protein
MELTDNMSRSEVKNKLQEQATIDALEKAFGRVVIQGNATYITNLQTGQEVQTNTVFNTIANTSVKGEVVGEVNAKFTDVEGYKIVDGKKEKVLEIRCDVDIKAREIETPKVIFTCFPLACLDENCRNTVFKDNDKFYLFFTSPMSGYLTVYLDDKQESQCLYPHIGMKSEFEGGVPVEGDKKYFLFSDVNYTLYTNNLQDINRLFVIFSKTPLNKPSLNYNPLTDEKGYIFPKSLPSEDFQKWLNTYRSSKENVQVEIIDIIIRK